MSDTTSAAPSDAELEALWDEAALPRTVTKRVGVSFARAVLSKWGTPPAVAGDPVAWYEYNADLDAWFLAYSHNPKAKTRPLVFGDTTPQPTQAQPVAREPLTDEQIAAIWAQKPRYHAAPIGRTDIEFARAIEAAHGIGTEKGDSHGLPT